MIILARMIGVGRTTYTSLLAKELDTTTFLEPVDNNPILDKYYEAPEKYGFTLQTCFLNKRSKAIKKAYDTDNNVLDRSIYKDALFTYINTLQGSINEQEYKIYLELLDSMMEGIDGLLKKSPDLLIYLEGSFDHIMNNIKKRGHDFKQPDNANGLADYYKLFHTHYNSWYENYQYSPKMKVNTDHISATKSEDWAKVYQMIRQEMESIGIGN